MLDLEKKELSRRGIVHLKIKVRTGANRTCLKEIMADGSLKIEVAAVPEKGRANLELVKYLHKVLKVDKNKIPIISGKNNKNKLIKIKG